jgi:tetratricopeptide (TPR) repeat protein
MQRQGRLEDSIKHHERHMQLAQTAKRTDEIAAAQQRLVDVYSGLADRAEASKDFESAKRHLQACLAATEGCDGEVERAMCSQKLGLLAQKQGNMEAALEFHHTFLQLSTAHVRFDAQLTNCTSTPAVALLSLLLTTQT